MATWQEWLRLLITLVYHRFFDMLLPANDLKKLAKLVAGINVGSVTTGFSDR